MADDTPDLISNISITGGDAAISTLSDVGDAGAAALNKLSTQATKSASDIGASTDAITAGLSGINKAVPDTTVATRLASIESAARTLGSTVRSGISDTAGFAVKLAGVGTAALGAIVGLAQFARSITAATKPPTDLTAELTKQQEKQNRQQASNVQGAIQYQQSVRDLNLQLAAGTLNYQTYGVAITALNQKFKDQEQAHEALQEAQRETLEQNQKLQIQASQTEAYNALVKIYGTDLTGSLITLGKQAVTVQKQLTAAFGPVLSTLVDKIIELINKNMPAISALIDAAAKGLGELVNSASGDFSQVIQAITDTGKAAVQVVTNIIIPAFKAFLAILDDVASFINSTFGTNISGKFLLILAVVLQVTGGFTALFAVIQAGAAVFGVLSALMGGPVAIAIVAVTVLLIALYFAVDWKALGTSIQNTFNILKTSGSDAINSVLKFFTDFPGNLAIVWAALLAGAQSLWDSLVKGFQSLVDSAKQVGTDILQSFTDLWTSITSGASSMYNSVIDFFNGLIDKAKSLLGLQSQASAGAAGGDQGGGDGSSPDGFAVGGHVRGPGSWTSDSILARLSNNEFVMQAKAVAKYGVGVMRAINAGAIDLSAGIPAFANGGLVTPMAMPRFASGGHVQRAGHTLNLTVGGETFGGLQMTDATADRLTKYAVRKQVASAGRKPSWVGGSN